MLAGLFPGEREVAWLSVCPDLACLMMLCPDRRLRDVFLQGNATGASGSSSRRAGSGRSGDMTLREQMLKRVREEQKDE
ncbi:hypothetical protein FPE53_24320 [Salmonella enterica subsp. enterica]|uniref:Uncharacterized protein n=1 Tax=Salmonella enterica subsp. enterica serovar Aqua TaxID=1302615 RepID=A0A5X6ETI9_SALET|nr:hypothetical protein [Salmonella enterica subsp. enterica serovar Aqua]ECH1172313.1 hypothetical protein [Salmonella enterica subsp. enterica serovar Aqua]